MGDLETADNRSFDLFAGPLRAEDLKGDPQHRSSAVRLFRARSFLAAERRPPDMGSRLELLERPVQGTVLLVESWELLLRTDRRQNDLH